MRVKELLDISAGRRGIFVRLLRPERAPRTLEYGRLQPLQIFETLEDFDWSTAFFVSKTDNRKFLLMIIFCMVKRLILNLCMCQNCDTVVITCYNDFC